jgi:hypothetical protein
MTNILPATTEMARQRYESIANFGKEMGNAIEKYGLKNQERVKNSMFAAGIIGNYLEAPEELTDEQDRPNPPVLSATAPSHIAKLYKKAESEGDGDWVSGMSGVSGLELESFLALQGKWEKDEQLRKENDRSDAQLAIAQAGQKLAADKWVVEKKGLDLGYDAAKFNYDKLVARGATEDELYKAESEVRLAAAKRAPTLAANELEKQDLELKGLRRLNASAEALDAVKSATVPLTGEKKIKTSTEKVYGQYEIDGKFYDSFDLEAELSKQGLGLRDIDGDGVLDAVAPEVRNAVTPELQVARKLAGDDTFEPAETSKDSKGGTTATSEFTRNVYERLIRMFPDKAEQIKAQFLRNPNTGGLDKELGGNTNAAQQYATAMKYFKSPTFQKALFQEFKPVQVNSPASKLKVLYTEPYADDEKTTTITYDLNEQAVWDSKIASVKESFAKAGKPFTLTNQDVYRAVNLYGGYIPFTINGQKFYMPPKGDVAISENQFLSLGVPSSLSKTEWEAKMSIHNTFLQEYAASVVMKDGKPMLAGGKLLESGYTIAFVTRDPNQPIRDAKSANFDGVQEFIGKASTDLNKVDSYIDRMKEMWTEDSANDPSFINVVLGNLFGGEWNSRYTANQRGLETFRKYFIAPGTETEKDAQRLADQMAEPKFQLWRNPELAREILDLTRSLIVDGIMIEAEAKGFKIIPPEQVGSTARKTPEQRTAIKNRLAELTGNAPVGVPTK